MNVEPADLIARLATGTSLSEVVMSLLAEEVLATLRRCAAARTFDVDLYEKVLRVPCGPELSELVAGRQVELDTPHRYRVARGLQDGAWQSWWPGVEPTGVPDELRRLSAQLAEVRHDADDRLAELRHLLVADQARARALFVELYDRADARLALADCHNLLAVLSDPELVPLLEPATLELLQDRQLRVEVRGMWYLEHHQSTRYLSRRELEKPLKKLVHDSPTRVLQLHATGGMGKTMQLRWFVARYCVPHGIPCARLDFDVLDPVNAVRHPWLLLLESARQLNRQMAGAPFTELLRDHGAYLTVLNRRHSEEARSGSTALAVPAVVEEDRHDVRARFAGVLRERHENSPVLIVADTLEEMLPRSVGDPRTVLEMFSHELARVPCARLVFSGRYDLSDRVAGFRELFPDTVSIRVGPFDDDQARRYLTENRGVTRADLADAVVRRANGLPFTLAAFADLVREDPDLTTRDIDQCDDPALLYCIERVVERIEDDRLRWLLRYGVVPRRLSYEFLVTVMRPYLTAGITGTDDDRPERDAQLLGKEVFRTGRAEFPVDEPGLRELWREFTTYASDYSWVSMSGSEPDTVVFHDDVVRPLRHLLSSQPVFLALHEQAAEFYLERAARHPRRCFAYTKDALYHLLQLGSPEAGRLWRSALDRARVEERPDQVAELCRELLTRNYVDEDGEPLPTAAGQPMVSHQLLADARLRLAQVLAEQAMLAGWPGDHPEWSAADTALAEATQLAVEHAEVELDPVLVALVRASTLLAHGRAREAAELMRANAGATVPRSRESRDVVLVSAEAELGMNNTSDAIDLLVMAHEMSEQLADAAGAARVALRLSAELRLTDDVDAAVAWARRAVASGPDQAEAVAAEGAALLAAGTPAAAEVALGRASGPYVDYLRARALLALRAPARALELCEQVLTGSRNMPPELMPHVLGLTGEIHAELLDFDAALDSWEHAIDMCRTVRDVEAAAHWAVAAARLHFRGIGDLREAAQFMAEAERLEPVRGGDAWLSLRLLRATLLDARGEAAAADQEMDVIIDVLSGQTQPPGRFVRVAVAGLGLSNQRAHYFSLLGEHLTRVKSRGRRLVLLRGLRHCERLHNLEATALLDRVAPEPDGTGDEPVATAQEDEAVQAFVYAELLRLAGMGTRARVLVTAAADRLAGREPIAWWDWIQALSRLGPATGDEPPVADTVLDVLRAHYPRHHALLGSYQTVFAARRVGCDPPRLVESRLDSATAELSRGTSRPHRMLAVLYDARANLAALSGDERAEHRFGASALSVFADLGHLTVPRDKQRYESDMDCPVVPVQDEVSIAVERNEASILVTASGQGAHQHVIPRRISTTWTAWQDMLAMLAKGPSRWILQSPVAETFQRTLHEVLTRTAEVDLRLTLSDSRLQSLPWELIVHKAHHDRLADVRTCYRAPEREVSRQFEVRSLQRLLTNAGLGCGPLDGVFGPLTQAGVREFQTRQRMPNTGRPDSETWRALRRSGDRRPVSVLVMQRSWSRSLKYQRGSVDVYPPAFYRRSDIAVSVLENPTSEQLERYVGNSGECPDVVHIRAAIEVGRGMPYLDFAASVDYSAQGHFDSRPERIFVSPLARFVQQVGGRDHSPLVILDIETPAVQLEAARALVFRNEFAHQLLALGTTQSILATGIGTPQEQERMYVTIADSLRDGSTAAQIAERVGKSSHPGAAFLSMVPPAAQVPIGAL